MDNIVEIKKLPTETEEEFLWRIGQLVDSGKVENWESVNDDVNREILGDDEEKYRTESAWRKRYQAAKKFYDNCFVKMESGTIQSQNNNQLVELEKQRVKTRRERNELRRVIREESDKESYREQFIRTMQEYVTEPLEYEENARFKGVLKTDNDLLISLYDIHAGMESNNFFNTYNESVLKDRLNEYLDKIFEVQLRHGSENAYLVLSETVSGFIHPTLRIENNQDMIEQFLLVTDYLSQFIRELSYHFNKVNVYMAIGNHGRLSPKKDDNLTHENMDNLVLPFLEAKLQNFDNVVCHKNDIEDTIAMFAIRGTNVFSSHGDRETPQNAIQKLTLFTSIKPDIYLCGHRHTNAMTTVYNSKVLQAGCLSGSDSYCMDKRLQNKPEQLLCVVTDKGLDCIYDVKFN